MRRSKRARTSNRQLGEPLPAAEFLQIPLRGAFFGKPDPDVSDDDAEAVIAQTAAASVVTVPQYQCGICLDDTATPVLLCKNDHAICGSCEQGTLHNACNAIRQCKTMATISVPCSCCAESITDISKLSTDSIIKLMSAVQSNAASVAEA